MLIQPHVARHGLHQSLLCRIGQQCKRVLDVVSTPIEDVLQHQLAQVISRLFCQTSIPSVGTLSLCLGDSAHPCEVVYQPASVVVYQLSYGHALILDSRVEEYAHGSHHLVAVHLGQCGSSIYPHHTACLKVAGLELSQTYGLLVRYAGLSHQHRLPHLRHRLGIQSKLPCMVYQVLLVTCSRFGVASHLP